MKAKLVSEALSDVLKGPSTEDVEVRLDELISDIEFGKPGYKERVSDLLYRLQNNGEMLTSFLEKIRKKEIILPPETISSILSGLKYKSPEIRDKMGKLLGKTNKSILDRSPKENNADKNKALKILLDYGFIDISGPTQQKRGTIKLFHDDSNKIQLPLLDSA